MLKEAGRRHSSYQKRPEVETPPRETPPQDRHFGGPRTPRHSSDRKERRPPAEGNFSEQPWLPRASGTRGKRGCCQTPKTVRVSWHFTRREETVSCKKTSLAVITCTKDKTQRLLPWGKVFVPAWARVEPGFDKGIFQNGVKRRRNCYSPGCVSPVLNYLALNV